MEIEGAEMASSRRLIKLTSSDGRSFEVEMAVAVQSQMIKNLIEADSALDTVSLQNVTGRILEKVIEYCVKHADAPNPSNPISREALKAWDAYFVTVGLETLFDLVRLTIWKSSLLDLTCNTVVDLTPPEDSMEIRRTFNIPYDFTPEEEPEVRRENEWSFE